MNIPQMEKMSREDIIDYMRKCAKQYVPEWRYDKKQPDAGTALVSIFADMMYDNIKKFNMSVAGDLFSFFDGINAKLLPASPAEGFVVFGLPEGFVSEAEVPSGTRLLADGDKEQLVFETQEEVLVCPLDIHKIFLAAPREDAIYELFDPQKDGNPSFFLFQDRAENLQRHLLVFCFGQELKIASHADARLSFVMEGIAGGGADPDLAEALCDSSRVRFYYGAGEEFRDITDCTYREGALYFQIPGGEQGIAPMENYASEEFESRYVIAMEILDGRFFSEVYLKKLLLGTECLQQQPEFVNVNGTDQEIEEFLAFGENPSLYDECFIGSGEIFGKAGAHICLEFDLDFVKIPLEEIVSGVKIADRKSVV